MEGHLQETQSQNLHPNEGCLQLFLKLNMKRRQKPLCGKLRSGSLHLAIKAVRFKGLQEDKHSSEFCDLKFDFIFCCSLFYDLTINLHMKVQQKNPDLF